MLDKIKKIKEKQLAPSIYNLAWLLGALYGSGFIIKVCCVIVMDENIDNHRYIGTSILWIYRIYKDIAADILKKQISISLKLIKIYKNIRKTS